MIQAQEVLHNGGMMDGMVFSGINFGLAQTIEGALQVYKAYHPTPV